GMPGAKRDARMQELLAAVGVAKRANQRPDELSGGEQQRVAIAVALANDPSIVLADEPTGELDSENASLVLDLLRTVSRDRGKTVLLVSHDPHAGKIADVTVDMADGRIVPAAG